MANTPTPEQIAARREVIERELAWHEEEAHRRFPIDQLLYDSPAFDGVVADGVDFLAPEQDEVVLDIACGEGKEALELAQRGAIVICEDLSHAQLVRTRELLAAAGMGERVHFIQANAEEPPFADQSFRLIYGKAIIHHLDTDLSAHQIQRLLKPQGKASFAEPLSKHPLILFGRLLTPSLRTQDETPLTLSTFGYFGSLFPQSALKTYFFFAPLAYLLRFLPGGERPFRWVHKHLQRFDQWLFERFPRLRPWAWYALVNLQVDGKA